jgi:hypothetical protein
MRRLRLFKGVEPAIVPPRLVIAPACLLCGLGQLLLKPHLASFLLGLELRPIVEPLL